MNRQEYAAAREIVVAQAIQEVVSELRLVDVGDYIAYMRLERFASIADLVESAAELYFMPGTIRMGHGGEALVDWSGAPRIVLDMELRPRGATVYFTLGLEDESAAVEVNYVAFDDPDPDPDRNTARLESALEAARIRKTENSNRAA